MFTFTLHIPVEVPPPRHPLRIKKDVSLHYAVVGDAVVEGVAGNVDVFSVLTVRQRIRLMMSVY